MKTKHLLLGCFFLLLMSMYCHTAAAQSNIDRIVKELEEKGVDTNSVIKRNSKSRKVYLIVKSLDFYSKEGKYAEQLRKAFEKDSENAVNTIIDRKGGKACGNCCLIFKDGKKKMTYTLNISGSGSQPLVNLSIIIRDSSVPEEDEDDDSSIILNGKYYNMFNGMQYLWNNKSLEALNKIDWSGMQKKMADMSKRIKHLTDSVTNVKDEFRLKD